MKVLTVAQTRLAEEYAFSIGFTGDRLMENAGAAAARIIKEQYAVNEKRIVVITGSGNNGGDGYVVVRKLKEYGAKVSVVMAMGIPTTKSSLSMQQRAVGLQIPMIYYYDDEAISGGLIDSADIIVDAIFGIGFHGGLEPDIKKIVDRANRSKAIRVALDIPSGVSCDSAEVANSAFKADATISFIGYKPCHFSAPAMYFCGKVFALSIGFELKDDFESYAEICSVEKAKNNLSVIPFDANKGTKGTVAIYAGSFGMAGAAIIAAKAAMRSGVGIVRLCIPECIYNITGAALPEVVFKPLNHKDGFLCNESIREMDILGARSILIGPGIGNNQNTKEAVKRLLSVCNLPTVIDADGLNCVADDLDILKSTVAQVIVTPHPGEMARLIKKDISWVEKNRVSCAKEFSKEYGVITVLKGAYTVIATPSGKCFINTTGCQGMATAGSGDMLSGMISAFLANGTDPVLATVSAVCLHGAAGEKTASKLGVRGMIVSDMIDQLPFVLN